ncbi:hypothetical protein [[Pseudomonas] boreopolis]|uniref:hypothetical protein n=1 Tax=Xanthomonas boreopolis TaxID=86183 RepID=UPI0032DE1E1E
MATANEPRPLPARIVVAAFQDAGPTQGDAGDGEGDFFLVQAASPDVRLAAPDQDWLQLQSPVSLAPTLSRIGFSAVDNAGAARSASVPLEVCGRSYRVEFVQQSGELVQMQLARTLNSPLNLDCLIAVCYVAGLIEKLSPPLEVIALSIAILAIVALALTVAIARHAFVRVPEPRPQSVDTGGVPIVVVPGFPSPALPLKSLRAEDQTIALQAARAVYRLMQQLEE